MQVVYSEEGLLHNPLKEITGGVIKDYVGKKKKKKRKVLYSSTE